MMTVRFPNGQAIQYNTANYANRHSEYSDLYESDGGKWIAQIPNSCIIESVFACRVYNPLDRHSQEHDDLAKEIKSIGRKLYRMHAAMNKECK